LYFHSPGPETTRALAQALARCIEGGVVVALDGPLGAGKTAFAQGLAAGLGVDPAAVTSPTFVLACEYPTPDGRRLVHVDLYRIGSRDELEEAGLADWLDGDAVVAIEWAERFAEALPGDRLSLRLSRPGAGGDPDAREIHALSSGPVSAAVLARWCESAA
jgi:tRNA threonylcarbamoyladenosine biosynthesis protein TsaE